jgi:hypothetical protein
MSAFRPDPARGRVLFRLHGFSPSWWFAPRAVLRVCCTPLPILGFVEFRAGRPAPFGSGRSCRPRRRFSPSKLFPCPQPSLFRGLLPSCRSPSGNPVGSTARPCSTGQVRRGSRCCHLLSLVASLGFSSTSCKKGFTFSAISTARSLRPCRGGSSFPTCHLALGLLAKSRAFGFGPCGLGPWPERWCGCRFGLPKQREARGAVGSFWFRFRSVPDASIRSRLESARGVGPCLSLATMTPAARNLDESLEI